MSQILVLRLGDCVERMKELPGDSVEGLCNDPPYLLAFMGKSWDKLEPTPEDEEETAAPEQDIENIHAQQAWHLNWLKEAFRVLQPGGIIKAFGGTRTFHRMAAAMEQARFVDIGLTAWVYGSGFPKSLNIAKALDKMYDYQIQSEVRRAAVQSVEEAGLVLPSNSKWDWTKGEHAPGNAWWEEFQKWLPTLTDADRERVEGHIVATVQKKAGWFTSKDIYNVTAPSSPDAQRWAGYGTALKPAWEPFIVGRKP